MKRLVGWVLVLSSAVATAQEPGVLLGKDQGYVLSQAQVVDARGNVSQCGFSGDTLLYSSVQYRLNGEQAVKAISSPEEANPPKSAVLGRWDPGSRAGVDIWRFDPNEFQLASMERLAGTDTVVCSFFHNAEFQYAALLNATSISASRLVSFGDDRKGARLTVAPDGPYFALIEQISAMQPVLTIYDGAMRVVSRIDSAKVMPFKGTWFTGWGDQGTRLKFTARDASNRPIFVQLNWATGAITEEKVTAAPKAPESLDIEIATEDGVQKGYLVVGEIKSVERLLVAAPCSEMTLSADQRRLAYVSDGILYVRSIQAVDAKIVAKVREQREKRKAMLDAKMCALALIMYASDYDDVFPSNDTEWRDKTMPYIKDREILDRFQYTFSGGDSQAIANPATQEIGYVNCPGGRAVAYADGHVKFVPDKP